MDSDAIKTLIEYKELGFWILGIFSGAGILGGIIYAINKRDNRLIQTGKNSAEKRHLDAENKAVISAKETTEKILNSQPGDGNAAWRKRVRDSREDIH